MDKEKLYNCVKAFNDLLDIRYHIVLGKAGRTAEYLMEYISEELEGTNITDAYLFIDKRNNSDERYCKSVFAKGERDYTLRQAKWAMLYKEKEHISTGKREVLYHHKSYLIK